MKKCLLLVLLSNDNRAQETILNLIKNTNKKEFSLVVALASAQKNIHSDIVENDLSIKYLDGDRLKHCILDLMELIKKEEPDLLLTTLNSNIVSILFAKMLSFKSIPIIICETDNKVPYNHMNIIKWLKSYITYNFLAQNICVLSNEVKSDIMNAFGVNEEKIKIIHTIKER